MKNIIICIILGHKWKSTQSMLSVCTRCHKKKSYQLLEEYMDFLKRVWGNQTGQSAIICAIIFRLLACTYYNYFMPLYFLQS